MSDKWAEYKEKFCGCKDASRDNSCRGRPNCELRADHPERKQAMTDIKEAREIELKSDWDLLSSPSRRIAESQQAVIDQLTIERDAARESMIGLDEITEQQSELIAQLRADLETANSMLVATSKAGIQLRERVVELEAKWRTEHDTANAHIMAHDAVRAELTALKSAPVVMPEPVGYTTAGMIECIKALPFTGRIGVRVEKTARWNIPLYTDPVYAKQVIDHGCSYGK